jgi:hypothetical protein
MTKLQVPGAVPPGTVTVMVEEEPAGVGLGLKVAVTPLGQPEALKLTDPE